MKSSEIRDKFLKFFESRGHTIIPSASVVPENDPSSLFTTAGMQPLVPYLLGSGHPAGNRLVNVQKCVRTNDIDEVGDATHLTFFQMLGNWSLGDYGKEEAIKWSYEFLTDTNEGLGLDPNRLYITVFAGNNDAPRDDEAASIWQALGIPNNRIYYLDGKSNWWSPGDNGPCGPSSEMFYDLTATGLGDLTHDEFVAADNNNQVVEMWNDVFMEYEKRDGQVIGPLKQKNIDTGAGLERLAAVLQGVDSVYKTDVFKDQLHYLANFDTAADDTRSRYIICDHLRAAVFMISDLVVPANSDQGYILRRLIRRVIVQGNKLGLSFDDYVNLVNTYIDQYRDFYPNLDQALIHEVFRGEFNKFSQTLDKGLREFEKLADSKISGQQAFQLFSTYGFPLELTKEIAGERGLLVDEEQFWIEFAAHQEASKAGAEQKFKGGLAGDDEMSVKYHTATHLLHAALRAILGDHVEQRGSNITPDRLRFDFSHPDKLTPNQKQMVEEWVNDKITQNLAVNCQMMAKDEALSSGAIGLFADKYSDEVSVYSIGEGGDYVSRELCGGPHVERTGGLGEFKIKKEEASSAGVRRIKAVLL